MDTGGLAQMTYNNNNNNSNGFSSAGLNAPASGFSSRGSRFNSKRLSVALPPKVGSISENAVENPTPRTSRSHLLAGLRTQPKTPSVPASAPYNQSQHNVPQWADNRYAGHQQSVPQTATGAGFDMSQQYAMNAARQMYSLPEQVLAPPTYDPADGMDQDTLQQLQMTSLFLAQRQQELQQKLAALSVQSQPPQQQQANYGRGQYSQAQQYSQTQQTMYAQQQQLYQLQQQQLQQQQQQQQQAAQAQAPIEVQPGVYLVYNPATQGYSYAVDTSVQQQYQQTMSPPQKAQTQMYNNNNTSTPSFSISPPPQEKTRSFTPPKKAPSPPAALENVQPLPPPSANAFRRGHKKATSLAINPDLTAPEGPKTSSAALVGTQRSVFPPTPMTSTFGPGAARAGDHPVRQPRGPPPIEELRSAPTTKHEGSKNFAQRQRRRALDSLLRAGTARRGASGSPRGSPVSESEYNLPMSTEPEDFLPSGNSSRKMSPIGSEMKAKRGSQDSADGYFGLSSASSSETEEGRSSFKAPPTPATPVDGAPANGGQRKSMLGVLNAAEKRRSFVL